jgi:hypothetical protein
MNAALVRLDQKVDSMDQRVVSMSSQCGATPQRFNQLERVVID